MEEEKEEVKEEYEDKVEEKILFYEVLLDGILIDEERAKQGPCECIELPSGKPFCWDAGIIGALNQEQIAKYCPPEKRITPSFIHGREEGGIPERIKKFIEASEACEIGKSYEGIVITNLADRLKCMSKELSKKGITV